MREISHLAVQHIIRAVVPNVTMANDILAMDFEALSDLPISEAIALCISTHGKWEGDRMKILEIGPQLRAKRFGLPHKSGTPHEVQHNDNTSDEKPIRRVSQAIFKKKIMLTSKNLFVYENEFSLVEEVLSAITGQGAELMDPTPEGNKQHIPSNLLAEEPMQQVCDDMKVAKFRDDGSTDAKPENDLAESILSLPPVKKRVSTEGRNNTQVRNTCRENPEAAAYVEARQKQGAKPEEIAAELKEAGAGAGVIGCLLDLTKANVTSAREHGKYLLKKAKHL